MIVARGEDAPGGSEVVSSVAGMHLLVETAFSSDL